MFRRKPRPDDVDAEIQFHLDEEARLREDRGEPAEVARGKARRAFGNVALAGEDTRAVWTWTALEQLFQDIRSGCRILTTAPALSAAAVLLIALVIGGNTTVFSLAHGFLRKPAEGVTARGLVTLGWTNDQGDVNPFNEYLVYRDLQEHSKTLDQVIGTFSDRETLNHGTGSYAVRAGKVSPNFFEALGVGFAAGRGFSPDSADERVAVISHATWTNYFQSAGDVVGKSILLSGRPVTIVGVAAPRFRGATLPETADLWVPLERSPGPVAISGRLAPGMSMEQARAELSALWARLQASHPHLDQRSKFVIVPYSINAGTGNLVDQRSSLFLLVFSVITVMTLLIVCANVANLLIARAVIRQRELALRQSLGASKGRIIRSLVAEGMALSVVSWAAACAAALVITRSLSGYMAPTSMEAAVMMPDFTPDRTVLGYAFVLAAFCTIACTIAPALRAWRQPLLSPLKAGEQAVIQGRSKVTRVLVVVQLAFSVVLVTSAGLVYRSLFLVGSFESGFDTKQLLLVTVNTAGSATNPQTHAALLEQVRNQVASVRGVSDVSFARQPPREAWGMDEVRLPGASEVAARAEINSVGPRFLETIGARLLAGRDPTRDATARTMPAAMISQKLAHQLWPGQPPLGRTIIVGDRDQQQWEIEIVGVVPDRYYSGFRREMRSFVFLSEPHDPAPPGESTLYVRYRGTFSETGPAIARALQEIDSRTAIALMRTWDSQIDAGVWPVRVLTTLLMLFAGGSLLIAAIGQYALVSFDMRRRVREVGLRMALGASARQVLRRVVREGLALTLAGLFFGFLLSLAVGRAIGGVLYGITPTDPVTYAGVFLLLSAASLLACYLPARRAARINPMNALRTE